MVDIQEKTRVYRVDAEGAYNTINDSLLFSQGSKSAKADAFTATGIAEKMKELGLISNISKTAIKLNTIFRNAAPHIFCKPAALGTETCNMPLHKVGTIEFQIYLDSVQNHFLNNDDIWHVPTLAKAEALRYIATKTPDYALWKKQSQLLKKIDWHPFTQSDVQQIWINLGAIPNTDVHPFWDILCASNGLRQINKQIFQKVAITALTHHYKQIPLSYMHSLLLSQFIEKKSSLEKWLFTDTNVDESSKALDHFFTQCKNQGKYKIYLELLALGIERGHPQALTELSRIVFNPSNDYLMLLHKNGHSLGRIFTQLLYSHKTGDIHPSFMENYRIIKETFKKKLPQLYRQNNVHSGIILSQLMDGHMDAFCQFENAYAECLKKSDPPKKYKPLTFVNMRMAAVETEGDQFEKQLQRIARVDPNAFQHSIAWSLDASLRQLMYLVNSTDKKTAALTVLVDLFSCNREKACLEFMAKEDIDKGEVGILSPKCNASNICDSHTSQVADYVTDFFSNGLNVGALTDYYSMQKKRTYVFDNIIDAHLKFFKSKEKNDPLANTFELIANLSKSVVGNHYIHIIKKMALSHSYQPLNPAEVLRDIIVDDLPASQHAWIYLKELAQSTHDNVVNRHPIYIDHIFDIAVQANELTVTAIEYLLKYNKIHEGELVDNLIAMDVDALASFIVPYRAQGIHVHLPDSSDANVQTKLDYISELHYLGVPADQIALMRQNVHDVQLNRSTVSAQSKNALIQLLALAKLGNTHAMDVIVSRFEKGDIEMIGPIKELLINTDTKFDKGKIVHALEVHTLSEFTHSMLNRKSFGLLKYAAKKNIPGAWDALGSNVSVHYDSENAWTTRSHQSAKLLLNLGKPMDSEEHIQSIVGLDNYLTHQIDLPDYVDDELDPAFRKLLEYEHSLELEGLTQRIAAFDLEIDRMEKRAAKDAAIEQGNDNSEPQHTIIGQDPTDSSTAFSGNDHLPNTYNEQDHQGIHVYTGRSYSSAMGSYMSPTDTDSIDGSPAIESAMVFHATARMALDMSFVAITTLHLSDADKKEEINILINAATHAPIGVCDQALHYIVDIIWMIDGISRSVQKYALQELIQLSEDSAYANMILNQLYDDANRVEPSDDWSEQIINMIDGESI